MTTLTDFEGVRSRLDDAVLAGGPERITGEVKAVLQEAVRADRLALPSRFHATRADTYARRLLHRDQDRRYTVVVMAWGPGQRTALHDHAGIWCVECVVEGEMEVTQYELLSLEGARYRFAQKSCVKATRGSAGSLIPPFEYHTLANRSSHGPAMTLHVYGGEMDHCNVFEPVGDGSYRKIVRQLAYHD